MTDYGAQDTSTTTLGTNQFPISEGWTPNAGFSATEAGPQSTDGGGKKSAPVSVYTKDGSDVTLGTSSDANTVASVMGRLTKIRDLLNATLTVSGTITEANSAAIKTDLDALNTAIGLISDAAWSGSGNGSEIAILKKIVAELAGTIAVSGTFWQATQPVSGTVTANAGTNLNTSALALEAGHLATIDSHIPAQGQALAAASVPVVLPATQITTLTPPAAITGFALEAGHLANIDTHTPAQGQNTMANSSPVAIASDQADLPIKRDRLEVTGSASANNTTLISQDVTGYPYVSVQVTAIAVGGTLTFQGSNDGFTTVESVNLSRVSSSTSIASTATTTGMWAGPCNFKAFRVQETAWTSGTSTVIAEFFTEPSHMSTQAVLASQTGTWTMQPGNTPNTTPWLATLNQGGNSATVSAAGALKNDATPTGAPPYVFKAVKAVTVTAGTGASVWTPAGGKKFRLLGFMLANSGTFASCGIILQDTVTINSANEFLRTPTIYTSNFTPFPVNLGPNGYLSSTINNQLWIDVTATATISGFVFGIEE